LDDQGADCTHFDWPYISRRQILLFHARACDELTPPIHRTPPGPHTRSSLVPGTPRRRTVIPGLMSCPGFGVINEPFDASSVVYRSEEHTSELQSLTNLVCRL